MRSEGTFNILLVAADEVVSFPVSNSIFSLAGGASVSNFEKKSVGASFAGALVKYTLGSLEGLGVGTSVCDVEGKTVGDSVGFNVGFSVGGLKKGSSVPNMRSFQTTFIGASVGAKVG
jgi:hypothetical protein